MVNGPSPGPAPASQARASNSRLTRSSWRTWPHRKLRRKVPRVDGAFTTQPKSAGRPAGAQHVGVIAAVAASQRGRHQGHNLVPRVRPTRGIAQVEALLYQLGQAEMQGQGGWQDQPSIGHQTVVIKGDLDAVGVLQW